jgi:hypothetical protein
MVIFGVCFFLFFLIQPLALSPGKLSTSELLTALKDLGYKFSKPEREALMKELDEDKNGSVDLDEFVNAIARIPVTRKPTTTNQTHFLSPPFFSVQGTVGFVHYRVS